MKYKTIEFWVAILGALVAIGVLAADFPINDVAELLVGIVGVVAALFGRTREGEA